MVFLQKNNAVYTYILKYAALKWLLYISAWTCIYEKNMLDSEHTNQPVLHITEATAHHKLRSFNKAPRTTRL